LVCPLRFQTMGVSVVLFHHGRVHVIAHHRGTQRVRVVVGQFVTPLQQFVVPVTPPIQQQQGTQPCQAHHNTQHTTQHHHITTSPQCFATKHNLHQIKFILHGLGHVGPTHHTRGFRRRRGFTVRRQQPVVMVRFVGVACEKITKT